MKQKGSRLGSIVDFTKLPSQFPTHKQTSEFWEVLGRTVATFGFLEEVLGKAIFSLTATTQYPENKIEDAYEKWLPKLERTLSDPLGGLIDTFGKAVRDNHASTIVNLEDLIIDLRNISVLRNVLCHASWRPTNDNNKSRPFFVNRQNEIFDSDVDLDYLQRTQIGTTELACAVINTVTSMGYSFPGSNGPGENIW